MSIPAFNSRLGIVEDSVRTLTALIKQISGAEACALYQPERGYEGLVRRATNGSVSLLDRLPYENLDRWLETHKLTALPLYEEGLLAALLVVKVQEQPGVTRKVMADLLPLLRSLLRLVNLRNAHLRMAARISDLELGLASEKISERLLGVLRARPQFDRETIELVEEHVTKVLDSCNFSRALQDQLRDLESNAVQREQTARAKRILQSEMGLSEQEAYNRLRTLSRQRRLKIADVAAEILQVHGSH